LHLSTKSFGGNFEKIMCPCALEASLFLVHKDKVLSKFEFPFIKLDLSLLPVI
jgi:hypothetical protein